MGELSNTTINGVSYDFKDAGAARQSHSHTKSQITDFPTSMPASDVSAWAKASTKPTYTASEVGAIATTAKGAANGVASLDSAGKVPSSQLPSYVDDVLEYDAKVSFPTTGEAGKIYVDKNTNKTYRWSGSDYVEISESLALGETSSTAYRGDRGKTAYDHSQVTSGNPHNVTKSDVGLSNVGNFKAVSTVASQGLSSTEQANARANIGAGTSSFSGSYNDLSNKPTSLPASDVYSWAKASSKPSYTASEVGAAASSHTHTKSQITDFPTSMTPTSHTHGNVQNGGTLQTNDIAIASGDKLIVTDSSDSNKIARASISFDGSTATQALTKKGTWETFNNYSHPTTSGNKHIPSGGSAGQVLVYGGSSGTASWGDDVSVTANIPLSTFATAGTMDFTDCDSCINKHGRHITGFIWCEGYSSRPGGSTLLTIKSGYLPSQTVGCVFIPSSYNGLPSIVTLTNNGVLKAPNNMSDYSIIILFDYFTA